ncbi:MAG: YCF48-related protein [Colwellia sp.]
MRLFVTCVLTLILCLPAAFADNSAMLTTSPAMKSALASKSLLLDIALVGEDKVVTVGHHGHILLSSDGISWQQSNVPVQATLTSVFFLNDQLGWAVGHDATILHSNDGGLNWQIQQFLPALEKPLFDIYFKNSQQGIAVGAYGQIYRSENGGKTWQAEFHQELLLADDIEYLDELRSEDEAAYLDEISFILPHFNDIVAEGNALFLLGEAGFLAKSTDYGITWQQFDSFYQGSFFSFARTQSGSFLVAGLRGHVFRAVFDNMTNTKKTVAQWHEIATDTTALLNDFVFANDERIFILGNNGTLLVSTDDGEHFSKMSQQDGKSLIAGVWFKGKLLAVSDVGVKVLDLPKE